MQRAAFLPLLVFMVIVGCATTPAVPPMTQLQIREFQTRKYDTDNTKMVMKALLNVLQDDGFIVKNASVELGLYPPKKM